MGLKGRVLKNTTYLTVGDKIGYIMQFVFFLYFAKKYGVVPVGEYSFAFFFTYAFALISDLGATVYLLREVARNETPDRQLFVDCLVLRTIALIMLFIIAAGVIALFFRDISEQKLRVIIYMGVYWVFFYLADVFLAELNGYEKMGRVALLGIWLKFITTAAGIFLIYAGFDYDAVLVSFPASGLFYLCTCVVVSVYTLGPFHLRLNSLAYYKNLLGELVPFFFSVILLEILFCQDILILGFVQDDRSVGLYSSAIKLITFILGVSTFVHVATIPVLSRLFVESRERLIDVSSKILRYLIIASLPMSFGMLFTADRIIDLFYSDTFQESSIVLKITCWAIAAGFIQIIYSVLLTAINRQKEKVNVIWINFIVTTLLNILIIYYYNYIGAAFVKVVSTVLGLVLFAYLVSKYLTDFPLWRYSVKPLIACCVMTAFGFYFNDWNLLVLISVSGLVYVISLLLMGDFTEEEISYIKKFTPGTLFSRG